ncbi:MAG: response regulator transcription factor [bacterium]|nr:response regulator transcription factor [bacterium]
MNKKRILLLEDDKSLRIGLSYDLEAEGYEVLDCGSCEEALVFAKKTPIDLAILDVNLPDGDGFFTCLEIKKEQDIPVIFLTARDLIQDEIKGFEVGADDYITKPFSNILLRKRVHAVLKRCGEPSNSLLYDDGYLMVDLQNFIARIGEDTLTFTPTEYKLLSVLILNNGTVVTRQMILEKLWDHSGNFVDEHALTVNINRIRSKIEKSDRKYIKTVYGLGYTWTGENIGG